MQLKNSSIDLKSSRQHFFFISLPSKKSSLLLVVIQLVKSSNSDLFFVSQCLESVVLFEQKKDSQKGDF